jgi:small subunit ribosomal protein S17
MPDKTAENAVAARRRNIEVGQVVGRPGAKTIAVEVTRRVAHPFYKRYVHRRKKFYAHDERNECRVGDWVRIAESRPLSRLKRWRLREIIARAPEPAAHREPGQAAS